MTNDLLAQLHLFYLKIGVIKRPKTLTTLKAVENHKTMQTRDTIGIRRVNLAKS